MVTGASLQLYYFSWQFSAIQNRRKSIKVTSTPSQALAYLLVCLLPKVGSVHLQDRINFNQHYIKLSGINTIYTQQPQRSYCCCDKHAPVLKLRTTALEKGRKTHSFSEVIFLKDSIKRQVSRSNTEFNGPSKGICVQVLYKRPLKIQLLLNKRTKECY